MPPLIPAIPPQTFGVPSPPQVLGAGQSPPHEMYPWQSVPMRPQSYSAGQAVTEGLQSVTWIAMEAE